MVLVADDDDEDDDDDDGDDVPARSARACCTMESQATSTESINSDHHHKLRARPGVAGPGAGRALAVVHGRRDGAGEIAADETVILLRPPLSSGGVSIETMRGCQQNDSLADG